MRETSCRTNEYRAGRYRRGGPTAAPHAGESATIEGMADPYAVLGLPPDAHEQDVNRVFRALARELHPERYVGAPDAERADAEARFKEVSAAYAAIKEGREERRTWAPVAPQQSLMLVMAAMVLTLGVLLAGVVATALTGGNRAEAEPALPALRRRGGRWASRLR